MGSQRYWQGLELCCHRCSRCLLTFVLLCLPAWATTYYVDNCVVTGRDSNNGTAPGTPWLTIAHVNAHTFSAGDSVLFQGGCMWREQLSLQQSGSSGNPITIASYGTGQAIINGANLLTAWTYASASLYYAAEPSTSSLGVGSFQLFEDGARLTQNTTSPASLQAGQWYLDTGGSKIWVYTTAGDDPTGHTMEISVRQNCIGNSMDYVALQNLAVKNAAWAGVDVNNYWRVLHSVSITGMTAQHNYQSGIAVYDTGSNHYAMSNVVISGNTTSGNGGPGIDMWADVATISPVSITNNILHDDMWNSTITASGSIHIGAAPNVTNLTVEQNSVYNSGINLPTFKAYPNAYWTGSGIYIDTVGTGTAVRYNNLYNNNADGLVLEEVTGAAVYGNIAYNNGVAGFTLDRIGHTNLVYNNTSYGNSIGFQIWAPGNATAGDFTDNQLKNNIAAGNTVAALMAVNGGENDGTYGSGNIYTYNAFGAAATDFIEWGNATYESTYSAWETATGNCRSAGCSHSIQTAPTFADVAGRNFTLASNSSAIDAGVNLGSTYQMDLSPTSSWASSVSTLNQNSYGAGWEIGAFVFAPQVRPAPPTSLSAIVH